MERCWRGFVGSRTILSNVVMELSSRIVRESCLEQLNKENVNLGEYEIFIEIIEDEGHVEPFGVNSWTKIITLKLIQTESM